ncbi:MAG: DUF3341 domain-containing protein [Xanthomonadaceae bacterium]|nr:DUF3341 domain-containing protein [Xanthomonadaceae bacterium]
MTSHSSERTAPLKAVVGFFDNPEDIMTGMKTVRAANFEQFDAYTPFPVHGLDEVQGLKKSWIPWVTLALGMSGTSIAFVMQYWMSHEWPHIIGGKPFNSWPAFVPIMFELTILLAGISTFVALLISCGFPNIKKKIFDPSITNNKFAIAIEEPVKAKSGFKLFSESEAIQVLKTAGAKDVRAVIQEGWFS